MNTASPESLFRLALEHHQALRLPAAMDLYRQVLLAQPDNLFARHYLGVALHQTGELAAALPHLEETTKRQPDNAGFQVNLANVRKELGRIAEAEAGYRTALSINPALPLAAFNLGQVLEIKCDLDGAAAAYRQASELTVARERLATLMVLEAPQQALALLPDEARRDAQTRKEAEYRLLRQAMQLQAHCGQATAITQLTVRLGALGGAEAIADAGMDLLRQGKHKIAKGLFGEALATDQFCARAVAGFAVATNTQGLPGEGVEAIGAAIERGIDHPLVWEAYADSLKGMGDLQGAAEALHRVLQHRPGHVAALSSLQQLNLCRDDWTTQDALRLAEQYGATVRMHSKVRPATLPDAPPRPRLADGRLRLGIVSPDLGMHPVGKFMIQFFRHRNRDAIELWAFVDRKPGDDPVSRDVREYADHVVECQGWPDAQLAEAIAQARCDVLLDLAGHTQGNRLPMFAWRLAPRQGTFLGYAGTTGAPEIDFRIADEATEPPGAEAFSSEQLIRLPGSYFCYDPCASLPPLAGATIQQLRSPTFGCFVQRIKISGATLDFWLDVLREATEARMIVRCRSFADPRATEALQKDIHSRGGDPARFDLLPWVAGEDHLRLYNDIDVALNTFPFQQATNLCDALWMGVPTISLSGTDHRSRMANSILAAVGHPEWCVSNQHDAAKVATRVMAQWRSDPGARETLRSEVLRSPLADGRDFAQRLSTAILDLAK